MHVKNVTSPFATSSSLVSMWTTITTEPEPNARFVTKELRSWRAYGIIALLSMNRYSSCLQNQQISTLYICRYLEGLLVLLEETTSAKIVLVILFARECVTVWYMRLATDWWQRWNRVWAVLPEPCVTYTKQPCSSRVGLLERYLKPRGPMLWKWNYCRIRWENS